MAFFFFVIILSVLVFVHEFGHFFAARKSGVVVEEFGFGFPPRIGGWRRGGTLYSINWIPFGGFVRLQGEQEGSEQRPGNFTTASFRHQITIMSAGVVMNAGLAWVLLTATLVAGVNVDTSTAPKNSPAQISNPRTVAVISEDGAAVAAGLHAGDRIITIDGRPPGSTQELIDRTKTLNYPTITLRIDRANLTQDIVITPRPDTDHPRYGFGLESVGTLSYPWYVAPWYGLTSAGELSYQTLTGFGRLLRDLLTTAHVSQDLTGPVGIAVLTGQVLQFGFTATLQFMAILSISLAVVNFLPLPALDGGRAAFAIIKKFRGRAVNPRVEGTIHAVGFYLLLLLIILISIRDVSRFGIVNQIRSAFQ